MTTALVTGSSRRGWPRRRSLYLALGLLAGSCFALYLRGSWADVEPREPGVGNEGMVRQLLRTPDGRTQVRAAIVLNHPDTAVWSVVTAYDRFADIFPSERDVRGVREADGRYRVTGRACIWPWGEWPFDVHVEHREEPGSYRSAWDEPGGDLICNRGSWTVTALDEHRTRLVVALELEVRPFPTFLVRNALLNRIGGLLQAVDAELQRRSADVP
jgi:hypothetical protein